MKKKKKKKKIKNKCHWHTGPKNVYYTNRNIFELKKPAVNAIVITDEVINNGEDLLIIPRRR